MNSQPKPQRAQRQLAKQIVAVSMSKSARRRRRRQMQDAIPYKSDTSYPAVQAPGISSGMIQRAQMNRARQMLTSSKMTPDGIAFLKCAFAPPDFAAAKLLGVPDDYEGKSLVKKHRLISSQSFNKANTDYYILLLPTPGYAYWVATVTAGSPVLASTVFVGVPYSDSTQLFNTSGTAGTSLADVVDKYRFVSNHFELVPTTNQMTWTGNVQTWRLPVSMIVRQQGGAGGGDILSVTGLQGTNSTNSDQYTGPFNLGVYSACYNSGAKFDFQSITENLVQLPPTVLPAIGDFAQLDGSAFGFPGLDSQFDSLVVKISGMGSNVSNTAILKTWACVEYQVVPGSSVYEYQNFSPCDPAALALYRRVINELPVGVAFVDNENFWKRVLAIIRRLSGTMSILPGPYGLAAGGVSSIATAIEQLAL